MKVINFRLLEKKILNKLNSPIVESNDNAVNLYDLNYAAKNGIIYQEEKNGSEQKREPKQETIER